MRRGADAHYGEGVSRSPAVVVVGAGLAGLRTAASLRTSGFTGHLTLVGDEGLAALDYADTILLAVDGTSDFPEHVRAAERLIAARKPLLGLFHYDAER